MRGQERQEELTGHIYKYNFRVCPRVMTARVMLQTHGDILHRGGGHSARPLYVHSYIHIFMYICIYVCMIYAFTRTFTYMHTYVFLLSCFTFTYIYIYSCFTFTYIYVYFTRHGYSQTFVCMYVLLVSHSSFTSLDICNCCNPALLEYSLILVLYSYFTRTSLCACDGLLASYSVRRTVRD
jgi:hypothetical protein